MRASNPYPRNLNTTQIGVIYSNFKNIFEGGQSELRHALERCDDTLLNQLKDVEEAKTRQDPRTFAKTLERTEKQIYETVFHSQVFGLDPKAKGVASLAGQLNESPHELIAVYKRLEQQRAALESVYKAKELEFVTNALRAKKSVFSEGGAASKAIVHRLNSELANSNERYSWFQDAVNRASQETAWFSEVKAVSKKNIRSDVFNLFIFDHASPREFLNALHGNESRATYGLDKIVLQAREWSYLQGIPLAEAMRVRLTQLGIPQPLTELYVKITRMYATGRGERFVGALYKRYEPALEEFDRIRWGHRTVELPESVKAPISQKMAQVTEAASESGWLDRILGERPRLKASGIAGGLALAGFAAYELTRRKEDHNPATLAPTRR
jgi:hypothetical protein